MTPALPLGASPGSPSSLDVKASRVRWGKKWGKKPHRLQPIPT
jgi:hypothetical protein